MIRFVGVMFVFLLSSILWAASFQCDGSLTATERKICSHHVLSSLDSELSILYKELYERSSDKAALKNNQRRWLRARNSCETTDCIKRQYDQRLSMLQASLGAVEKMEVPEKNGSSESIIFKNIYSRKDELCTSTLSFIREAVRQNYEALSDVQKAQKDLSYVTTQGEMDVLGIMGAESAVWSSRRAQLARLGGSTVVSHEYIYTDINNDGKRDYVVKVKDGNTLSDGYGWQVYPELNFTTQQELTLAHAKKAKYFTFRDNNINIAYGDHKEVSSRNFHFSFVSKEGRVYVIIMLHYGYSSVSQENIIVADLNKSFKVNKQYCHIELTMGDGF